MIVNAAIVFPLGVIVIVLTAFTDKLVYVPPVAKVKFPVKFNVVAAAIVLVVVPKFKTSNQLVVVNVNALAPVPVNVKSGVFDVVAPVVPNANVLVTAASLMNVCVPVKV